MAKPARLYIAADGPRNNKPGERERCERARDVLQYVDWECTVKTLFRESNLGCKIAVSSGITWFFDQEEEGIILEDDCVPNQSFFTFCATLLDTYRSSIEIMHIGGSNFQPKPYQEASYYFSNYSHVWGWATWKRAWSKYDRDLIDFYEFMAEKKIDSIFGTNMTKYNWLYKFWRLHRNKIDTWDYQWIYSVWNNNGVSIIPACNLVSNIGFNEAATHTKSKDDRITGRKTGEIHNIIHPEKIVINHQADRITDTLSYNSTFLRNIMFWMIVQLVKLRLL